MQSRKYCKVEPSVFFVLGGDALYHTTSPCFYLGLSLSEGYSERILVWDWPSRQGSGEQHSFVPQLCMLGEGACSRSRVGPGDKSLVPLGYK